MRTLSLFVLALLITCAGCTQGEHLSLLDASNAEAPVICYSTKDACGGQSPSLAWIIVVELKKSEDFQFLLRNAVWITRPKEGESTGSASKEVHYGTPPFSHWENQVLASPLRPCVLYSINDQAIYVYWYEPDGTTHSELPAASHTGAKPNPSIERTGLSQLRCLKPAAHVER